MSLSTDALPPTETDVFFKNNSPDLTPADRAALDGFATKYVADGAAGKVTIEGWASVDGVAADNKTLSEKRAKAVVDYLISKGVPKTQVSGVGRGPTPQFGGGDPQSNRRATIAVTAGAAPVPPTPAAPPFSPLKPDIDPSSPGNKKAIEKTVADSAEAEKWIRDRLTSNGLRPDPLSTTGNNVLYQNKTQALKKVIDDTVTDGKSAPIKAPALVTRDVVARIAGEVLLAASPGGGKIPGRPGAPDKPDDDDDDPPAKVVVGPGGATSQVEVSIPIAAKDKDHKVVWGKEVKASVTIGADGKLGEVEADFSVVTAELKKLGIPVEIEVSVNLGALPKLADRQSVVDKVLDTVKVEVTYKVRKYGSLKASPSGITWEIPLDFLP